MGFRLVREVRPITFGLRVVGVPVGWLESQRLGGLVPDRASDHGDELQVHALSRTARGVHCVDVTDVAADAATIEGVAEAASDVLDASYSVAGNTLATAGTLTAMADSYRTADPSRPLAARLVDALAAGDEAGGDRRDADTRSTALRIVDTEAPVAHEYYDDLRADASPTPIAALRTQYERARSYHEQHLDPPVDERQS